MTTSYINYIEFKAADLEAIKKFYNTCFGWQFTDYGTDYVSFSNSGLAGGFTKYEKRINNGALVILYHPDLVAIKAAIIEAGGKIMKDIFDFPGGHRFHFKDPTGNMLAIWSDLYQG